METVLVLQIKIEEDIDKLNDVDTGADGGARGGGWRWCRWCWW